MEKLLFATSNPISGQLSYLPFETQIVREKALNGVSDFEFDEINNVTFLSLLGKLTQYKNITMLHYSGHSNSDGFNLDFAGQNSNLDKKAIADIVRICPNLRFVFLNSCCSNEIAEELLKVGIPFVIGTTKKVQDLLAATVAYQFYSILASKPITINQAFELTKASLTLDDTQFITILKKTRSNLEDSIAKEIASSRGMGENSEDGFWWELKSNSAAKDFSFHQEWTLKKKLN